MGCLESEVIFMFVGIFGDIFWDIVKNNAGNFEGSGNYKV